ncbi:MAG: hypothetical protein IPK59_09135 [Rhodospirillaceae bacterium]|nr:hypothetical protein [Rhodospirillaceae bacterium]
MRWIGLTVSLALATMLGACFIQHPAPIGVAEGAQAGEWSGVWVAQPNRDGEEPGFFRVTDVDPAAGQFEVEEADADGTGQGDKMELRLRRVGEQRFLDVREKTDGPWMLFVVESATADEIVLAWKPAAAPFEAAIARGDYQATLTKNSDGDVSEIVMANLNEAEAKLLAANWRDLFVAERMTMRRMASAD